MNQSQFLAITCNLLEAREKTRVHGAIGFGFAPHWLKNRRDFFKPISKRCNRNLQLFCMGFLHWLAVAVTTVFSGLTHELN